MSTNPPVPTRHTLSARCKATLWTAGATTLIAAGWPLGDVIYMGYFDSPSMWWLLVLVSLACWITAFLTDGQDRLRDDLERELRELHDDITSYGDEREANGAALAAHFSGRNGTRPLTPVK